MRILNTAYGLVPKALLAVLAGLPPSAWEAAARGTLRDLETKGIISGFSLAVYSRLQGIVVYAAAPGLLPATITVHPREGKGLVLHAV